METGKKEIIINEIQNWRQNKILPEHYCDFLLHLYSEGEALGDSNKNSKKGKFHKNLLLSMGITVLLMIGIIVMLALSTSLIMQLSLSVIGLSLLYFLSYKYKESNFIYHHLFLGAASVFLLIAVLWQQRQFELFVGYEWITILSVLVIWFVSGLLMRAYYLIGVSVICTLFVLIWMYYPTFFTFIP